MRPIRKITKKLLFLGLVLVFLSWILPAHAQELSTEEMLADIEYVSDILRRVHPAPFHAGSEKEFEQLVKNLKSLVTEPMSRQEFFFVLNQILVYARDGHTFIIDHSQQEVLPVRFQWVHDGLVVTDKEPTTKLVLGDKVLSINERPVESLLGDLAQIIPAENAYWLKVASSWRLIQKSYLEHLSLTNNDQVELLVEDEQGRTRQVVLEFVSSDQPPSLLTPKPMVEWSIDEAASLAIFSLRQCLLNDEYVLALEQFFQAVRDKNIKNVALDVRENTGGNSQVIEEFLKYLPKSRVRAFSGEIRYSKEAADQRGYSRTSGYHRVNSLFGLFGFYDYQIPTLKDPSLKFDGRLFVLTSAYTFSTANWFAVVVQDNQLGQIVGEPTGNAPSSYGDVIRLTTPNSQFAISMSHKKWVRPKPSRDPSDALYPDLEFVTTIDDIRNRRDPQLEGLRAYILRSL